MRVEATGRSFGEKEAKTRRMVFKPNQQLALECFARAQQGLDESSLLGTMIDQGCLKPVQIFPVGWANKLIRVFERRGLIESAELPDTSVGIRRITDKGKIAIERIRVSEARNERDITLRLPTAA